MGFYTLFETNVLRGELLRQLFADHPVEYVATAMFFVGLALLLIRLFNMADQQKGLKASILGPIPKGGTSVDQIDTLIDKIDQVPRRRRSDYLVRRLEDALDFVRRSDSAGGLLDELRFLSEMDAGRAHSSYGLNRVIIWAIPMLGFLGTVIGITLAIGNLSGEQVDDLSPVVSGLSVAFLTTIQALALSIALMFAQYFVEQRETALMAEVDFRAEAELVGRFEQFSQGPDGQLTAVRRMIETVVQSNEELVQRQIKLWWSTVETAGEHLTKTLAGALDENLQTHARELVAAQEAATERNMANWQQTLSVLTESTQRVVALEETVVNTAELLQGATDATDQIARLETVLNGNLDALAGSKHFEETVMSLAAAIHLLNSRLGEPQQTRSETVKLQPRRTATGRTNTGRAA